MFNRLIFDVVNITFIIDRSAERWNVATLHAYIVMRHEGVEQRWYGDEVFHLSWRRGAELEQNICLSMQWIIDWRRV